MSAIALRAIAVIVLACIGLIALLAGSYLHDQGQLTRDQVFILPLLCGGIAIVISIVDIAIEMKERHHG